jgi:hypothetical protein
MLSLVAAALAAGAAIVTSAPAQAESYWWYLTNKTNQPIYGDMFAQQGSVQSAIGYAKSDPQKPDGSTGAYQKGVSEFNAPYYWGRYCYNGAWWNLNPKIDTTTEHFEARASTSDPATLVLWEVSRAVGHRGDGGWFDVRSRALVKTDAC